MLNPIKLNIALINFAKLEKILLEAQIKVFLSYSLYPSVGVNFHPFYPGQQTHIGQYLIVFQRVA